MILPNCHSEQEPSFACAQAGCVDCMGRLLKQNELLIYLVVSHQCPGNLDYADLRQVGRIGLWQAILHFRPELGYPFWHYAGTAIRHHIWRVVECDQKGRGFLEANRSGDSLSLVVETWQQEQLHQALAEELLCLPERLRQIIELAYGFCGQSPMSLAAIGRQMGCTRERIRQLRNEALLVMRLPALSIRLRGLCERDTQRDYRQSRQENDTWLRRRRGLK